jgi:hypothetical protein
MSRGSSRSDALAPSLFPFLAVLLCTIGALVLILMLSVSGAQSTANQMVSEFEEEFLLEEAKLELVRSGLSEKISENQITLEKRRLALQGLEQHIHELLEELDQLQRQMELANDAGEKDQQSDEQLEKEISELEKQLAEATEELEQQLEEPDGDKPIFAIIPYQGPNGTHRRPIYLECNAEGVIIQPEGVVLSNTDLKPPYGPGNPLDAALRTIRSEYPSTNGSVTNNPYPLLVVRPSGIRHYMMARSAMAGWDDQFGYELISEDLELAFPPGPPHLHDKLLQTLALARQRQAALIAAMPKHYERSELAFESPSLSGGNPGQIDRFEQDSNWLNGQAQPPPSSDGRGGFSPGGSAFDLSGSGSQFSGPEFSGSQFGPGMQPGSSGSGILANSEFGQSAASNAMAANGMAASGSGGLNSAAVGPGMPGSGSIETGGIASPSALGEVASGQAVAGPFVAGQYAEGQAGAGQNAAAGNTAGGSSTGGSATGGGLAGGSAAGGSASGAGTAGGAGSQQAGSMANSQSSNSGGGASQSSGGQTGSGGSGGAAGMTAANSTAAGNPPQSVAGQPGSLDISMHSDNGGSAGSSPQNSMSSFDPQQAEQAAPTISATWKRPSAETARPVAQHLGSNWAWDKPGRTQTSVIRSINMQCLLDRWVLLPEKNSNAAPVVIELEGSEQQRAERLAAEVRKRVEGWGVALAGGHWTPVLQVEVASDADWRYQQLRRLMDGSGISVLRRGSFDPKQP